MSSRRNFLQAAAAASLLPFSARVSLAAIEADHAAVAGATVRPWLVVAERRSAAAAAFAIEAGRRGIPVRAIDGDVTALWYDELDALWRARPAPIAGLTARPALFCLERLAWDRGMRVVYHAEHTQRADGTYTHIARMPVRGLSAPELTAEGELWSGRVASVLARLPAGAAAAGGPGGPGAAVTPATTDETATVFSWMISPVGRGA